jgi:hypothetical protein
MLMKNRDYENSFAVKTIDYRIGKFLKQGKPIFFRKVDGEDVRVFRNLQDAVIKLMQEALT